MIHVPRIRRLTLFVLGCAFLTGCRQQMAGQPSFRPYQPSKFFADGRSARPLIAGTVARGSQQTSGMKPMTTRDWTRLAGIIANSSTNLLGAASATADWSLYEESFPMKITKDVLERGQERFNIYCAVCHDRVGTGHGMIVERGFTKPPSYHTDYSRGFKHRGIKIKLTEAPVGYFYDVITNGYGAMPDYATQVPPNDRWAIIAYIRVLQFSQNATLADIRDAGAKQRLLSQRGGQP